VSKYVLKFLGHKKVSLCDPTTMLTFP
jgi:hypothetical protein